MFLISGLLVLTVILLLIIRWYYVIHYKFGSLSNLPGPKPIPVIGSFSPKSGYDFLKMFIKRKEKYGNIYQTFVGSQVRVVISHPGIVQSLLTSPVHLGKSNLYHALRPIMEDGLITSESKKWKERRRLITPTFHFQIMDKFLKTFNVSADILVKTLHKEVGKPMDITAFTKMFALDVICETAMGVKINVQKNPTLPYALAIDTFLSTVFERGFSIWKINYPLYKIFAKTAGDLKHALQIFHGFSRYVINKRKQERQLQNINSSPKKDEFRKEQFALLDTLLNESNRLSNDDINEEINSFLIAGHDTINTALAFTLLHLSRNKDVQNSLYQEIVDAVGTENTDLTSLQLRELKYMDMVIKETLRITPPIPLIERKLEDEFVSEGIKFPKDTIISIFIYGLHMDPEIYPDPEKFDPERFSIENQTKRSVYTHIPFSAGSRNCIGQRFALLELKCALTKILQNFELEMAAGYKEDLFMVGVLKSSNGICMRLKSRNLDKSNHD